MASMKSLTPPQTELTSSTFATKAELAQELRVCKRTIDTLQTKGCPHIKIGARKILFDLEEVRDWIKRTYSVTRNGKAIIR